MEVGEAERTRVDVWGADGVYTISVDGRDEENKFKTYFSNLESETSLNENNRYLFSELLNSVFSQNL